MSDFPKLPENGAGTSDGFRGRRFGDVPTGKDPFGPDGKDPLMQAAKATTAKAAAVAAQSSMPQADQ